MHPSRVCPVFAGFLAVLALAMILPTGAAGQAQLTVIKPDAGTYTPPSDFVSGLPAGGLAEVLGFDTLSGGATIPDNTAIRDQYLPTLGVEFGLEGSTSGTGKLVAHAANSMTGGQKWGDDSISESNTLASWNTVLTGAPTVVRITFVPQGNQLLPRAAGLVFTDSPFNDVFTLKAYDITGNLLGTIFSNKADKLYNSTGHAEDRFLGFQYFDPNDPAVGIAALEYTIVTNQIGDIVGDEVDNLTFEERFKAVTPEPATLALLGLGAAAVVRLRRRVAR